MSKLSVIPSFLDDFNAFSRCMEFTNKGNAMKHREMDMGPEHEVRWRISLE